MSDIESVKTNISLGKARENCVFKGNYYRITILSNNLIRLEYNENGIFNDYPTIFATNRYFKKMPSFSVKEDTKFLNITTDLFILEYSKEKPYESSKLLPDSNFRITIKSTNKQWYYNNPEVKNLRGTTFSFDYSKNFSLSKGLYNLDGFASFDDSNRPIIDKDGFIKKNPSDSLDMYLFIYENFNDALDSYFELTGYPALLPRYAFGVWWNKNEDYNAVTLMDVVNSFNKENMPEANEDIRETLKRKNKSIDICTQPNQNRTGLLEQSPKKSKKKVAKKKKKSKSKIDEIKNISEDTVKKTENEEIQKNEEETPTPNGNDNDMEYFYLIDYQTKEKEKEKENNKNNNEGDITPRDEEDEEVNFHTFHENDSKETPENNNYINENNTEKKKNYNFPIFSLNSSNGFNNNNKVNINTKSSVEGKIRPEKINFEEIKINDNDNNKYKLKKIKFREKKEKREKREKKENKVDDDLLFGKGDDKNEDNSNVKNDNKFSVIYKQLPKKRKKIITKKKPSAKVSKIILIQSMWKK